MSTSPRSTAASSLAQPLGPTRHVGGQDHEASVGEQARSLLGDALDAGSAGHQRIDLAAPRAMSRRLLDVPAMMAHEGAAETVFDEPGRTLRTGEAVPAGAAQGQGGVATAVQEQQRLLAARDGLGHGVGEARRDPAPARRPLPPEVDGRDGGQAASAVTRRQPKVGVASRLGVDAAFEGRRRRGQDHRGTFEPASHHRHVAGMVGHAIVLLVGGLMLLVDDDQAEVGEGQEEARPGTGHDANVARSRARPDPGAAARRHARMPFGGPRAEALGETVEELRRQRDFGQQDQGLPSATQAPPPRPRNRSRSCPTPSRLRGG